MGLGRPLKYTSQASGMVKYTTITVPSVPAGTNRAEARPHAVPWLKERRCHLLLPHVGCV